MSQITIQEDDFFSYSICHLQGCLNLNLPDNRYRNIQSASLMRELAIKRALFKIISKLNIKQVDSLLQIDENVFFDLSTRIFGSLCEKSNTRVDQLALQSIEPSFRESILNIKFLFKNLTGWYIKSNIPVTLLIEPQEGLFNNSYFLKANIDMVLYKDSKVISVFIKSRKSQEPLRLAQINFANFLLENKLGGGLDSCFYLHLLDKNANILDGSAYGDVNKRLIFLRLKKYINSIETGFAEAKANVSYCNSFCAHYKTCKEYERITTEIEKYKS